MIKLLKAGLFRLKKDVIFWIFIFLTIGIAGFTLFRYTTIKETQLDKVINEFITYIGLFIAIFVSIFVGKEYSQGLLRNKIIVGHSRISIFLSNLIISVLVVLLCEFIYIALIFLVGIPLFGKMQMSLSQFGIVILNTILVIISFCSIFNFISMICSEITVAITICIVLFIAMFIAQSTFALTANSKKYIENTFYDENGNKHIISQELNPNYPGDHKVRIAKTMYLLIPQGQASAISSNEKEYLYQLPFYSLGLIIIINTGGIILFRKKELK